MAKLRRKEFKEVDNQKWESFEENKTVGNFVFLKVYQAGNFILEDCPKASMMKVINVFF